MANTENVEAIRRFHKRREYRLRQRLAITENIMEKYRILKAIYCNRINEMRKNVDGGPGSGNHGHQGVPGQVGGSAPEVGEPLSESEVKAIKRFTGNNTLLGDEEKLEIEKAIRFFEWRQL